MLGSFDGAFDGIIEWSEVIFSIVTTDELVLVSDEGIILRSTDGEVLVSTIGFSDGFILGICEGTWLSSLYFYFEESNDVIIEFLSLEVCIGYWDVPQNWIF